MEDDFTIVPADQFGGNLKTQGWSLIYLVYKGESRYMYYHQTEKRIIVSDEGYWNPDAATGTKLSELIAAVKKHGYLAGVSITPYALPEFEMNGRATVDQLLEYAQDADFVALDPYIYSNKWHLKNNLIEFTRNMVSALTSKNKQVILIAQGFAEPGFEPRVLEYNTEIINTPGLTYYTFGDALDFPDIPDSWQMSKFYNQALPTTPKSSDNSTLAIALLCIILIAWLIYSK